MENVNNTEFDPDDVSPVGYYDEERKFTAIVACFIAGLLFIITLAFCVGYSLAKNKYTKPVQTVETTQLNIT